MAPKKERSTGDTDRVRYMSHFPHTFLKAYGRVYPVQTTQKFLYFLKLTNCEWLQRPDIAISEMAETITENLTVLEHYRDDLIDSAYLDKLRNFYDPIWSNLVSLNSKNEDSSPDETDVAYFLKQMLTRDQDFDDALDNMYEAAAAIYNVAIHTKCVRQLMRNTSAYASKIPAGDKDATDFQNHASIPNLQRFLTKKIVKVQKGAQAETNKSKSLAG